MSVCDCFSSSTGGVFLVRPLPVSFAIQCYSLSSQSRIAVTDDNVYSVDSKLFLFVLSFFWIYGWSGPAVLVTLCQGRPSRLWQRPTTVIVGCIAGRTCKNKSEVV